MMVGQQVDAMADQKHLAKLKEGVEAWNTWRQDHADEIANLGGVDLHGANLSGISLRSAYLTGANFSGANLSWAKVQEAHLPMANLSRANLSRAQFRRSDLSGADLRWSDLNGASLEETKASNADFREADLRGTLLSGANLSRTRLKGANLAEAIIVETIFRDVDLSAVHGLADVRHRGPSVIDIDTIYRSEGKIPESFLRGCGVPEDFITYMKSLTGKAIQFYSCFISYAFKDQDFADRLYADLQNKGVRCWFAPHDVQGGRKLHEQIDEAIRLHDKLLLILSPHSMESEWVMTEIAKARKREVRDQRRVLFPIRLAPFETLRDWECFDADTGKDSAREIREYFIPDFSNWKNHDSYQDAFQRLISDLQASDAKAK
jgi:uncharacterized protein YjbI with pentapeptide repeats